MFSDRFFYRARAADFFLFRPPILTSESSSYKEGVTQMGDVGGDGFAGMGEEGVGMLEIANLSLDEPSLEVALFIGEDITKIEVD
ncbi:unnamed protein product [Prunus brigantina]